MRIIYFCKIETKKAKERAIAVAQQKPRDEHGHYKVLPKVASLPPVAEPSTVIPDEDNIHLYQ